MSAHLRRLLAQDLCDNYTERWLSREQIEWSLG
jgi:hypothetical protein